ncbi:MAG: glycolate oxidase subunit GlcE [Gammaproteobacteria bacterium]|nr:glycolate oxidase subunit GlcE [Gammaproteobacteria bacterium]
MADRDDGATLTATIAQACANGTATVIGGHGSKSFFTRDVEGELVSTVDHIGVLDYRPDELVITTRSGMPLKDLASIVAAENQMIPFDPPHFNGSGTVGGALATGLSGPGRPWFGSVRDCVLGVEIVNGLGERMNFGGQVIKNVAGYDISRLMVGSLGTLGLILSASIKVLPAADVSITVTERCDARDAAEHVRAWMLKPYPITATCHVDGVLYLRLSGSGTSVAEARDALGLEEGVEDVRFWAQVRDHEHAFFDTRVPLWRLSLPRGTYWSEGDCLTEWAGAQVWLKSDREASDIHATATQKGGYARRFGTVQPEQPATNDAIGKYTARLKEAFDPMGVLNPGLRF